jgi:hypothetical protein
MAVLPFLHFLGQFCISNRMVHDHGRYPETISASHETLNERMGAKQPRQLTRACKQTWQIEKFTNIHFR